MNRNDILQSNDTLLHFIQRSAFQYFLQQVNPQNGLVADSSRENAPASIAATGMALSAYPVAVARGFWSRSQALQRSLVTLRFFDDAPQNAERDGVGLHGFFYHFLEMDSGRRAWKCELSSIDTALLVMGALTVAAYFRDDTPDERELRERAHSLVQGIDWNWMCAGGATVSHGWKPERGFLKARWQGYNEALLLQVLALGSSAHSIPENSYDAWLETYRWKTIYGHRFVYAGPLFVHQFPHLWLDLRGLQDRFMHEHQSDYFENSRRATLVQREYARRNPRKFEGYEENCWGITASDGPGLEVINLDGRTRRFYAYRARGVPFGPDDGTLAPWCAAASLPFAPEFVLPLIRKFAQFELSAHKACAIEDTFNPTYPTSPRSTGHWIAEAKLGLDQGPLVLMLENYRSGLLWDLLRDCSILQNGLRRANFQGGRLTSRG